VSGRGLPLELLVGFGFGLDSALEGAGGEVKRSTSLLR